MADKVTLLDHWASMYGMRCKIALQEKGIEYECEEENPFEPKRCSLLKANPLHRKVPVLIHNGKPICESFIILQYIEETWKDKSPLMPSDPYSRAHARFWTDYADKKISTFGNKIWTKTGDEREAAKKGLIQSLQVLEGVLGDHSFFGGEAFGLLDLTLVPYYSWFHSFEKFANFSIESECPKFIAWAKRCLEREIVSKTLSDPAEIYDFLLKFKKRIGIE